MHIFLILILFLTGCTTTSTDVERSLNEYALAATTGSDLQGLLVGDALASALETRALISSLGLQSFGSSRFSDTKELGNGWFRSCLDVAGTSFRDANGEPLFLERLERQKVRVEFVEGQISRLELEGEPC
jgi:hypothetical protein